MHHWRPCLKLRSAILIVLSTVVAKDAKPSVPVIMVEEKRSDRRQSGSIFLAGNFGLCSEIVGVLAWRYEHRIRRREDLLFSFGSERGPFPKDGPGYLGCRPSLSPAWRISPGSIILVFFCRFTGTVCTRGTDTFSVLAHSFSPFVSHFDTHFYTSVTAPCSAGVHKATVHIHVCMQKPRSQSS